jgi:GGDEF domain-containing protein
VAAVPAGAVRRRLRDHRPVAGRRGRPRSDRRHRPILAALFRQFTLLDENRRLRVTVADIALRDPLTGLANRALFTDRLTHAMQLRHRRAAPVAVLLLNLDDFKLVNDSLGHAAGDNLLCAVDDRVQDSVRTGDTVARLGATSSRC